MNGVNSVNGSLNSNPTPSEAKTKRFVLERVETIITHLSNGEGIVQTANQLGRRKP